MELSDEREKCVAIWHPLACTHHCPARNQVARPRTTDGRHCRSGVSVCGNLRCVCDALTPRPGCESVLEWLRGGLKPSHDELFGHGLGDEPCDDVTQQFPALLRCNAVISSGMLAWAKGGTCCNVLNVSKRRRRCSVLMPDGPPPAAPRRPCFQTMKIPFLSNSGGLAGTALRIFSKLCSLAREGVCPHPSMRPERPRCRVRPETNSSARRAAEISPILINASARSTLFSTVSTLVRLLLDRILACCNL